MPSVPKRTKKSKGARAIRCAKGGPMTLGLLPRSGLTTTGKGVHVARHMYPEHRDTAEQLDQLIARWMVGSMGRAP